MEKELMNSEKVCVTKGNTIEGLKKDREYCLRKRKKLYMKDPSKMICQMEKVTDISMAEEMKRQIGLKASM